MEITCVLRIVPDGTVLEYRGPAGSTFEDALLSFNIIPDTVLIRCNGKFLAQDMVIEGDEAEVILT
ncbi:MAG: thiamine S protein [Methanoregulaceae archaeon]|nr:thiamine S protein [Methanoregulaceae archaeon]